MENEKFIVGEDMICPITKQHCDDECCTVGSECNVSGGEISDISERPTFEKELSTVINRFSKENDSDTPDFILAEYMNECLQNFNKTMAKREVWYGRQKHKDIDALMPIKRMSDGAENIGQ